MTALPPPIDTDALVIGAGPAGLFTVFQLGLREIRAHVVDALPHAGGQCVELYGDKPLYDIPALPVTTGSELTGRLLAQVKPFAPTLHLSQLVSGWQRLPAQGDQPECWLVQTREGLQFRARAVVLAAGVGAFLPRPLKIEGLDAFAPDTGLKHALPADPATLAGQAVVIVGGGEPALAAACALATLPQPPASVTVQHRRDAFDAEPATLARFAALRAAGAVQVAAGLAQGFTAADGHLTGLHVLGPDGATHTLPLSTLLVLQGLSPRLGPLADWGLALTRRQVAVDPANFATSLPGVYAVGDVVNYPGKQRLILSGFHEATLAAVAVAAQLQGPRGPLEYTSSSAHLQRLLGVLPPA